MDLEPGARFVLTERWACGRVARGERHAYRRVDSRLHVRVSGRLAYADALVLAPDFTDRPGVFEAHAYLATGVALQRAVTQRVDAWRARDGRASVAWARFGS